MQWIKRLKCVDIQFPDNFLLRKLQFHRVTINLFEYSYDKQVQMKLNLTATKKIIFRQILGPLLLIKVNLVICSFHQYIQKKVRKNIIRRETCFARVHPILSKKFNSYRCSNFSQKLSTERQQSRCIGMQKFHFRKFDYQKVQMLKMKILF